MRFHTETHEGKECRTFGPPRVSQYRNISETVKLLIKLSGTTSTEPKLESSNKLINT